MHLATRAGAILSPPQKAHPSVDSPSETPNILPVWSKGAPAAASGAGGDAAAPAAAGAGSDVAFKSEAALDLGSRLAAAPDAAAPGESDGFDRRWLGAWVEEWIEEHSLDEVMRRQGLPWPLRRLVLCAAAAHTCPLEHPPGRASGCASTAQ